VMSQYPSQLADINTKEAPLFVKQRLPV
jgi:hypothetical protein